MEPSAIIFKTLLFYSLAEYQQGHVSKIDVLIKNDEVSIADNGRGHATSKMIGGVPYLKMVYTQLHMPFEESMPEIQLHALGLSYD
jgi:DNA gyrase/topoisomerase IV subunit B